MSHVENFGRIERAYLNEDINKYYPGSPAFWIPSILPFSQDGKANAPAVDTANKTRVGKPSTITSSKTIRLRVSKDIVRDYKTKIIPKGTVFLVSFIAGSSNAPVIIGME